MVIRPKFGKQSGMTLIEVAITSVLFAFIGYVLTTSMEIGVRSHETVSDSISSMDVLRTGARSLREALRTTSEATVEVVTLSSGDTELTLQEPLSIAGVLSWGVYETRLGGTAGDYNKVDWKRRYTVISVPDSANAATGIRNDLRLRLLDDSNVIQFEETLIEGLFQGGASDPGFRARMVGDLWEVSIQSAGSFYNSKGPATTMQVRARN